MRLRKPCEHDRYEAHWSVLGPWCPGGEFLPEDALRYWVSRSDGEPMGEFGGFMVETMDAAKEMVREELEIERDAFEGEDHELPTYTIEVSAVVERIALAADQVGEPG